MSQLDSMSFIKSQKTHVMTFQFAPKSLIMSFLFVFALDICFSFTFETFQKFTYHPFWFLMENLRKDENQKVQTSTTHSRYLGALSTQFKSHFWFSIFFSSSSCLQRDQNFQFLHSSLKSPKILAIKSLRIRPFQYIIVWTASKRKKPYLKFKMCVRNFHTLDPSLLLVVNVTK